MVGILLTTFRKWNFEQVRKMYIMSFLFLVTSAILWGDSSCACFLAENRNSGMDGLESSLYENKEWFFP